MNWNYESDKQIIITYDGGTITNADVLSDSFSLTERLCSGEQLEIGSCEASELRITIANNFGRLKGKEITVELCNSPSDTDKYMLGKYTVVSDKAVQQREFREIVACDKMCELANTDVSSWYNTFWNNRTSATVAEMLSSFASAIGVSSVPMGFWSNNYVYNGLVNATSLMATDVLRAVGELFCVTYRIGRDGNLTYVSFPSATTTSTPLSKVIDLEFEEYTVNPISRVEIKATDDGTVYGSGSGINVYAITGNILTTEESLKTTGAYRATQILNTLSQITYVPMEATFPTIPFNLGEKVRIPVRDGSYVESIVLERTLNGIQGMTETIQSFGYESREIENGVQYELTNLGRKTSEIKRDVDSIGASVNTISSDYVKGTQYRQDAEKITLQFQDVEREITQITEELDGDVIIYDINSDPTANDTSLVYPSYNFTENVICGVSACGNITFEYTDESYRKHSRDIAYWEEQGQTYRFARKDGVYYWNAVSDSDFGIVMERTSQLQIDVNGIDQRVTETETEITDQGKRITTAEANITTNANAITAEVKRVTDLNTEINGKLELKVGTDDNDQIVSMLNTSANVITLNSNRLVVNSDNFKVAADGSVTATSASVEGAIISDSVQITGGTLDIGNGNFKVTNTGAVTAENMAITGGSISIKNGSTENFKVTNKGVLTAKNANIEGTITSSNATITGGSLKVGSNFEVKNTGALTAKNAKITGTITSANATITGGTINIATDADNSIITISSHDDEVLQDLKTEIYSGVVELTQSYTGVFSEIIAGYGSINVSKTEGTNQKTTDISAGAIKLNNEPVLTPSSLAWVSKSITLNASNTSATITATEAKNKNTLIIRGKLLNTYPYQMLTIPVVAITTSKMTYSMSYGSYNLILGIVKDSTGKITLSYESASMTSSMVDAAYLQ